MIIITKQIISRFKTVHQLSLQACNQRLVWTKYELQALAGNITSTIRLRKGLSAYNLISIYSFLTHTHNNRVNVDRASSVNRLCTQTQPFSPSYLYLLLLTWYHARNNAFILQHKYIRNNKYNCYI